MIVETEIDRLESESFADIEATLEGRVFDVTLREFFSRILVAGVIVPNQDGALPTTFGSSANSFFRNRGCVSVFDFRGPVTDEIKDFRRRCWPFRPALPRGGGIAMLIFDRALERQLIPWSRWTEEAKLDRAVLSEMVVPHVEAGHPGPISIHSVERVILLRVREDPSSIMAMMRNAMHPNSCG